jgi:hypothetical protein
MRYDHQWWATFSNKILNHFLMQDSDLIHQLFQAVADGELETVKDLLSRGVPWNSMMDEKSVGDVALENGCRQIYEFLVEEGI